MEHTQFQFFLNNWLKELVWHMIEFQDKPTSKKHELD